MPVTTPSPTASQTTPASTQASGGIMSSLYRLRIGAVNTDYYQQRFDRFETQGKATPSWNNGAAFFTLAWLLMRQMFRPAMIYAGFLCALLVLWWSGLHGRVPMAVEATIVAVGVAALCLLPGLMGNALYYQHVRNETLEALNTARSITHAQAQLQANPVSKERLNIAVASQAVASVVIAGLLASQTDWAQMRLDAAAPSSLASSGPPDLVIPSASTAAALQPFTPDVALPAPEAVSPVPVENNTVLADSKAPGSPPGAEASKDSELSVLTMAQAIPAQTESSNATLVAAAATATAAAAPLTKPSQPEAPAPQATAPAPQPKPAPATKAPPAPKTTAAPVATKKQVSSAPKTTATKSAPPARTAGGMVPGKFYLNAGVYAQITNVERSVKTLNAANLPVLRQTVSSNKGELTRLRIGPFDTRAQAERAASQARRLRFEVSVFQQPLK